MGVTVKARLGEHLLTMIGPAESHLVRMMRRTGKWYEHRLLMALREMGLQGCFVDVGAHLGSHTVAFCDALGARRVIAIEPHEGNLVYLRQNAATRPVAVVQAAVSSNSDPLTLSFRHGTNRTGRPIRTIVVEPDTIDEILEMLDERAPVLLKIDVDKHHGFDALRSATRTIERARPVIAVEACEEDEHADITRWLAARGYEERGCYEATPTYLYTAEER